MLQSTQGGDITGGVVRRQLPQGRGLQVVTQVKDTGGGLFIGQPAVVAHDRHQRFQTAGLGIIRHGDTLASLDVQKAQPVQLPQSLMHHRFADLHFIGKLPLGGQAVAGAQLAGKDQSLQLLHKKLPQRGSGDLLKRHGKPSLYLGQTRTINNFSTALGEWSIAFHAGNW